MLGPPEWTCLVSDAANSHGRSHEGSPSRATGLGASDGSRVAKRRVKAIEASPLSGSSRPVDALAMVDAYDDDLAAFVVDAIQNAVGSASR